MPISLNASQAYIRMYISFVYVAFLICKFTRIHKNYHEKAKFHFLTILVENIYMYYLQHQKDISNIIHPFLPLL